MMSVERRENCSARYSVSWRLLSKVAAGVGCSHEALASSNASSGRWAFDCGKAAVRDAQVCSLSI